MLSLSTAKQPHLELLNTAGICDLMIYQLYSTIYLKTGSYCLHLTDIKTRCKSNLSGHLGESNRIEVRNEKAENVSHPVEEKHQEKSTRNIQYTSIYFEENKFSIQ